MSSRLSVVYRLRADAASVERRALAIAIEQSVEMPLAAVRDQEVLAQIVGRVASIEDCGDGHFDAVIELSSATFGTDPGQLINMLFGNTSLQDDVVLRDFILSEDLASAYGGPRHGLAGLRERVGAGARALSCSALKPQGMPADALAGLAGRLARGRLDFVKDDHGLADQAYSPFAERVAACAAAVRTASRETGHGTRYVPSLSGHLDLLRRQVAVAREHGLDTVMVAPMVVGLATFHQIVTENADIAFLAHPALGGASRIAPQLLIGKLFPLLGADAVIFPNFGGRFGYTPDTCRALAEAARTPPAGHRAAVPVPAGGMGLDRVREMLQVYGADTMLLIGGALLSVPADALTAATAAFAAAVAAQHCPEPRMGCA